MAPLPAILEPRAALTLDDYVRDLAWSPDGRSLAVAGGEGRVYLVGVHADTLEARTLGEHLQGTLAIAWPARGMVFATSGQDGAVALWDAAGASILKRWQPSRSWTEVLAWSPDARLLASAAGRVISLWTATGERVLEIPDHPSTIGALAWDKPGRELGAAINGGIRVHRLVPDRGGGAPAVASREFPWAGTSLTVSFSPNGKVLAAGMQDGSVHFWYLSSGRNSQMSGYGARVALTGWSANGRYLATSAAAEVVVWDFGGKGPEGTRPAQLTGHTDRVESFAWQPSGPYLVSGGRDWRLSLWMPGKAAQAVDAHMAGAPVTVVRWSPDSRLVAVGEATGGLAIYQLVQLTAGVA